MTDPLGSEDTVQPPVSSKVGEPVQISVEQMHFINALLDRADRQFDRFKFDLWTYRSGAVAGTALLIGVSGFIMFKSPDNWKALVPLVSASGLFAVVGDRSVKLLREQLDSIREPIRAMLGR